MLPIQLRIGLCVSFYGKQRSSDTHIGCIESGVTALGSSKETDTCVERGREGRENERVGRKGEEREKEERRRGERRETSWPLPVSLGMCGPEPSGPVSGVEESENSVG